MPICRTSDLVNLPIHRLAPPESRCSGRRRKLLCRRLWVLGSTRGTESPFKLELPGISRDMRTPRDKTKEKRSPGYPSQKPNKKQHEKNRRPNRCANRPTRPATGRRPSFPSSPSVDLASHPNLSPLLPPLPLCLGSLKVPVAPSLPACKRLNSPGLERQRSPSRSLTSSSDHIIAPMSRPMTATVIRRASIHRA